MALAFILLFISAGAVFKLWLRTRRLKHFSGPWLAKFTDLWRLWQVVRKRQPPVLVNLHESYQSTAIRTGPNIIDICDPALVEPIYGSRGDFLKSDMMRVLQVIKDGKIVFGLPDVQERGAHSQLKKPIAAAFSMANTYNLESFVNSTIEYLIKRLDEEFLQKGKCCEMHKWAQYFAFDCIGELTFSRRIGFLEAGGDIDGMLAAHQKQNDYRSIVGQMPWLDQILKKNPLYLLFAKPTNPLAERTSQLLQVRATEERALGQDLYNSFHQARIAYPELVSDTTIMRYTMNTVMGGADTTAMAIRSIIYYVISNPAVLARLQNELDNADLTYPPDFRDLQKLSYLEAVFRESLRIHPGPGFSLERVVPEGGIDLPYPDCRRIPGGCIVAMNTWALHSTESIFGPEPHLFRPERWLRYYLNETEEQYHNRLTAMKKADLSFSQGPRVCIGKHIAQLQIYKLIATLFGLFHIELANPDTQWKITYRFLARQSNMDVKLQWRVPKH